MKPNRKKGLHFKTKITMAEFSKAIPYILKNEGGYVNDHSDLGGETYEGISRKFNPKWAGWIILDAMPHPIAEGAKFPQLDSLVLHFYQLGYWNQIQGDKITSQPIAVYIFDWDVNSGGARKQIQELVGVTADGVFGNGTIAAINAQEPTAFMQRLVDCRIAYYREVATIGSNAKFLPGWIRRAQSMLSAA
jgi:lysozyme family protein